MCVVSCFTYSWPFFPLVVGYWSVAYPLTHEGIYGILFTAYVKECQLTINKYCFPADFALLSLPYSALPFSALPCSIPTFQRWYDPTEKKLREQLPTLYEVEQSDEDLDEEEERRLKYEQWMASQGELPWQKDARLEGEELETLVAERVEVRVRVRVPI